MKLIRGKIKQLMVNALAKAGYMIIRRKPRPQWPEDTSRFIYQNQFNNFKSLSGSIVLDIGSGAYPFPFATILTDRFLKKTCHRSEEIVLNEKPFLLSDIEHLPFKSKAFDFVYCSHVLEHVDNPIKACSEIVRIGKGGYIETPTLAKDMLFSWAQGMHKWHLIAISKKLIFFEYSARQLKGVQSSVWQNLIFANYHHPLQDLFYNNADLFNVMFNWHVGFECIVYYLDGRVEDSILR